MQRSTQVAIALGTMNLATLPHAFRGDMRIVFDHELGNVTHRTSPCLNAPHIRLCGESSCTVHLHR